jgi:hypothetical protein
MLHLFEPFSWTRFKFDSQKARYVWLRLTGDFGFPNREQM